MDYQSMTERVQVAFSEAQALARKSNHQEMDEAHLFMSLFKEKDSLATMIIERLELSVDPYLEQLEHIRKRKPEVVSGNTQSNIYITSLLQKLLLEADKEKDALEDQYMSVEHLLLAAASIQETAFSQYLKKHKITKERLFEVIYEIRGNQKVTSQNPESTYDVLNKYGRDLVEEVKKGKIDPVIGRDAEIRNVIRILSRKTKNNPVLIGEPGVGKTAIVEGLAQRIVRKDVPEGLKDKTVFRLI